MNKGIITLELEGVTEEQTFRYKEIIHILITTGSLDVRNGKTILNFTPDGEIGDIELQIKKYRRKKIDL